MAALTQDLIIAVHPLTHDLVLEVDVMSRLGLNLQNSLIDMIGCLRINVRRLIVGNLMISRVLISVLMLIMRLCSVLDYLKPLRLFICIQNIRFFTFKL